LGHVEQVSGPGKAAGLMDGPQGAEVTEFEVHAAILM
jgi:hypothetical protein